MLFRYVLGSALCFALFWQFGPDIWTTIARVAIILVDYARAALLPTLWIWSSSCQPYEDSDRLIMAHLISWHNMKNYSPARVRIGAHMLQHRLHSSPEPDVFVFFEMFTMVFRTVCHFWLVSGQHTSVKLSSWIIFHSVRSIATGFERWRHDHWITNLLRQLTQFNVPLYILFPLSFLPLMGDSGRIYRYEMYLRIPHLIVSALSDTSLLQPNTNTLPGAFQWRMVSGFCPLCLGTEKRWRTFKFVDDKQTIAKFQRESCTFCWGNWKKDETIAVLDCEHAFHEECLEKWISSQKHACPTCSKEF